MEKRFTAGGADKKRRRDSPQRARRRKSGEENKGRFTAEGAEMKKIRREELNRIQQNSPGTFGLHHTCPPALISWSIRIASPDCLSAVSSPILFFTPPSAVNLSSFFCPRPLR